jgi:hypothetical protein
MKFVQEAHEHAFLGKKYIDDKFLLLEVDGNNKTKFFFFFVNDKFLLLFEKFC